MKNRDEWLSSKIKFWIQMVVLLVGILGAWGQLDKNVALIEQKLEEFERIQEQMQELQKEFSIFKESFVKLETKIEFLLQNNNYKIDY